jgi:hypothetical protein
MNPNDFSGPVRGGAQGPGHDFLLQDLERHIRAPALKQVYRRWRAALLSRSDFPAIDTFDFRDDGLGDHAFVVAVEDAGFRFVTVGPALTERYGRPLVGTLILDDAIEMFGSLKASYHACVEREAPVYEYVRYALGEDKPFLFERLIMPFFDAGSRVTHLGGVVLFTDLDPTH